MPNQPTFELLRRELRHRGLPRGYVDRVVEELADHQDDIEAESAVQTTSLRVDGPHRLGDPAALADSVVAGYHRRTFAGRHPIWTFVAAPLPTLLAAWALSFTVLVAIANIPLDYATQFGAATAQFMHALFAGLPPALVAVGFCWLAMRSGRGWRWAVGACAIVALATASFNSQIYPPVSAGTGRLLVGFGLTAKATQALVPAGFALLMMLRLTAGRRKAVEA